MNISSERFDKIANQYLTSEVHQMSETMKLAHEISIDWDIKNLCDVACGAGHFGLSFRNITDNITAVDPSKNMLNISKKAAEEKGITTYRIINSFAEELDLDNDKFDLVISRLAPHHFTNIQKSIDEMFRITKPSGHVIVIDLAGYIDPDIDNFNHRLEILHDPTHVKSYNSNEWITFFEESNFNNIRIFENQCESKSGVSVERWCQIANSGIHAEEEIRKLLRNAPKEYLEVMQIRERDNEFYFPIKTNMIVAEKSC